MSTLLRPSPFLPVSQNLFFGQHLMGIYPQRHNRESNPVSHWWSYIFEELGVLILGRSCSYAFFSGITQFGDVFVTVFLIWHFEQERLTTPANLEGFLEV